MNIELFKILRKRFSVVLMIATSIVFPLLIYIVSRLHAGSDSPSATQLPYDIVYGVIRYSQISFFIPVWIIVFVGLELTNGHANRVVFAKSRKFYVVSKMYYGLLISFFFTILAVATFSIVTLALEIHVEPFFYFQFVLQFFLSAISISTFLLGLTFLLRSPIITYIVYVAWTTVEGLIYTFFKVAYGVKLFWLPTYLLRTLYVREGDDLLENYYSLEAVGVSGLTFPLLFALAIIFSIYYFFPKSNLKPLSD